MYEYISFKRHVYELLRMRDYATGTRCGYLLDVPHFKNTKEIEKTEN